MEDRPFFSGVSSGGGGDGSSNYNSLIDQPVMNVTGDPVIIRGLVSGIYNIRGTWSITRDDTPRPTRKDDLFCVYNDENECRLTCISAGDIHTYRVSGAGNADQIEGDCVAKETAMAESLVGDFK